MFIKLSVTPIIGLDPGDDVTSEGVVPMNSQLPKDRKSVIVSNPIIAFPQIIDDESEVDFSDEDYYSRK